MTWYHPALAKRTVAALDEDVEKLRKALKPFADAVFNDNGDMTISPICDREAYIAAYFAMRR